MRKWVSWLDLQGFYHVGVHWIEMVYDGYDKKRTGKTNRGTRTMAFVHVCMGGNKAHCMYVGMYCMNGYGISNRPLR